jgi:hypothetical protein
MPDIKKESTENDVNPLQEQLDAALATIAAQEEEIKKLKHRIIRKGCVAVNEAALKTMFSMIWNRRFVRMESRKFALNQYEGLFDTKVSGEKLLEWISSETKSRE